MSDLDFKYADFERDGEEKVRERIALKAYLAPMDGLAREWLRRKDGARAEAERLSAEATRAEERRIARSAKNAAWAAAIAAIIAAIAAVIAVFVHSP